MFIQCIQYNVCKALKIAIVVIQTTRKMDSKHIDYKCKENFSWIYVCPLFKAFI